MRSLASKQGPVVDIMLTYLSAETCDLERPKCFGRFKFIFIYESDSIFVQYSMFIYPYNNPQIMAVIDE